MKCDVKITSTELHDAIAQMIKDDLGIEIGDFTPIELLVDDPFDAPSGAFVAIIKLGCQE